MLNGSGFKPRLLYIALTTILVSGLMIPILPAFSSDPGGTFFPRLETDSNGDVHIVWWTAASGDNEIYYTKINGQTGEPYFGEVRITHFAGYSARPDIEVDSQNNVHIVWLDHRTGNSEIFYTKLDNNGNTLIDDLRLTFSSGISVRPCIAMDSSDNIYITWYDGRDGNDEVYYKKLDNNGNTLINDIRVTNAPGLSQRPYHDIDSNDDVHISWMDTRDGGDYEMYYAKLDGQTGNKIVPDSRLTSNPGISGRNALVVDSEDNVHITYMNGEPLPTPGNIEIYYVKLGNNGEPVIDNDNDAKPDNIRLTFDPAASVRPNMDIDSTDNIHIVWVDERDGNREIYYSKIDKIGNTIIDDRRVSTSAQISDRTYVAIDKFDDVHIIWQDDRGGRPELFYSKLDNQGNSIIDDKRITFGHPFEDPPVITLPPASDIQNPSILWADERVGNIELYYKKLDGEDGSTMIDDLRLTDAEDYSIGPSIATDQSNGNMQLVWQDNRFGSFELFHTKLSNDGIGLTVQRRLTTDIGYSVTPTDAIDGSGNVHIVWQDSLNGPTQGFYTKLDSSGNILVATKTITSPTQASSHPSTVTDSAGNVHVVWQGVFYSKLDNNGNVLVDHLKIGGSISTTRPSIAVDGSNNIHVAWSESKDGNPEIYYAKLDNNGNNLLNGNIRITNNQAFSTSPRIVVDGAGQIIIVWSDSGPGNPEIFYTKLDSTGNKVLGGDIRLTNNAGRSFLPNIAVEMGSGSTHIAFLEINSDHPDNVEVYYAKIGPSGSIEIPAKRVTFTDNHIPVADAGTDQFVNGGDTVELDGSASDDPDGDDLSFSWKQLSGPTVALKAPGSSNPMFIGPMPTGSSSLVLQFQLTVTDSKSLGQQDTVVVTINGNSDNCAGLTPTIIGTENADMLTGTTGVDVIAGLGGDDVIKGLGGNDLICGGGGNDTIYGADGNDELYGGVGNDIIYGTDNDDKLYGDEGADKLYGGMGIDTADGGSETDSCFAETRINCESRS